MAGSLIDNDAGRIEAVRIDAEARDWILRRNEPGAEAASAAWRAADPRHDEAWRRAELVWSALGRTAQAREGAWRTAETPARSGPGRFAAATAIAACLAAAVLGVTLVGPDLSGSRIKTRTAQVRTVDLADGSRVFVGARSSMDVRIDGDERRVVLKDGEAFFEVAHDAGRPFTVVTDDAVVRVTGTRFDVRRTRYGTQVSVLDGRVEVRRKTLLPASAPTAPDRVLTQGEQVRVERGEAPQPVVQAPVEAGAWRRGRLLYNNAPLREIVADANRYSDHPIRLSDPAIGELRVTVSFRSDAVGDLVANLDQALPIRAERRLDGGVTLSPEP
jgi:transmembrane sensor